VRVFFARQPADMRRSLDGLAALTRQGLGADPLSGHLYVFRNRIGDRVKILYWDRSGLALWYKRLERGTFQLPASSEGDRVEMSTAELLLILEGLELSKAVRRKRFALPLDKMEGVERASQSSL
jgi:transposase